LAGIGGLALIFFAVFMPETAPREDSAAAKGTDSQDLIPLSR